MTNYCDFKLIHCAETIKGGISSYLREIIPLQCDSFGAKNILLIIPRSQVNDLILPPGVVVVLFDDSCSRTKSAIRVSLKTLEVVKKFQPTVIHIHSTFAGATVRPILALFWRRSRVVYCSHGWAWDRPMSNNAKYLTRTVEWILSFATDKIICISSHELKMALKAGLPFGKLVLAKNAVSKNSPTPSPFAISLWPQGVRKILFVGRLDEQKGVDILIKAMPLLSKNSHLVIAGAAVIDSNNGLINSEFVTTVGWVSPSELETLFLQADILVVPSRWEGFGLVAAEAMRAGLPVVAAAVGGLSEIVQDGITGKLYEPNTPSVLANVLNGLTDEVLEFMGNSGPKRILDLFSIERLHEDLIKAYLVI